VTLDNLGVLYNSLGNSPEALSISIRPCRSRATGNNAGRRDTRYLGVFLVCLFLNIIYVLCFGVLLLAGLYSCGS